jgi:peptide/nickel transport system permease protein
MALLRVLAVRALTMAMVLVVVLFLMVVILGATGYSDLILRNIVREEINFIRQGMAETIRDPAELERIIEKLRQEREILYGLDKPWYTRLPQMIVRVFTLDLGEARTLQTVRGSRRVSEIILERLPNTVLLFTTAWLVYILLGIPLGVYLSTRVGARVDRSISIFASISYAVPTWWLALFMIMIFAISLRILPSGGMYSSPPPEGGLARFLDLAYHTILPVITIVLAAVGPVIYSTRTLTLTTAQEDHVTYARAKGLTERAVMGLHILRVAAPPIVTGLLLGLTGTIAGGILTETVFNWRGMGRLYWDALRGTPDEAVIIGLTFIYTLIYVLARFILEVLYLVLDPRVRY